MGGVRTGSTGLVCILCGVHGDCHEGLCRRGRRLRSRSLPWPIILHRIIVIITFFVVVVVVVVVVVGIIIIIIINARKG